jgi:hypothetical protein
MMRIGIRLGIVALILLALVFVDRGVDAPSGRGDALMTEYGANPPETPGVSFPAFATGFSVFIGAESDEFDYPKKVADLLDRLASLNVNAVSLVFSVYQDGPEGSEVYARQGSTPTDASLQMFIRAAHARGMAVLLRPTLDEANLRSVDRWRGQIDPGDVTTWFKTYGELIGHYAELCEREQVASLSVGVEFESMEQYHDQWRALIGNVRDDYSGLITYSFNFQRQDVAFADLLDFVGLDAYYPLDAATGATVAELDAAWQPAIDALMRLQQATGKQIVLTEIGLRSQADTFRNPFAVNTEGVVSQEDQATYYAAMCDLISTAQVSTNGTAIRAEANANAAATGNLAAGARVRLIGEPVNDGLGTTWQVVPQPQTGQKGYMTTGDLAGRPIYGGSFVWFAYLDSLAINPATDMDYPPFNKLAEPVLKQCYGERLGRSEAPATPATSVSPTSIGSIGSYVLPASNHRV